MLIESSKGVFWRQFMTDGGAEAESWSYLVTILTNHVFYGSFSKKLDCFMFQSLKKLDRFTFENYLPQKMESKQHHFKVWASGVATRGY